MSRLGRGAAGGLETILGWLYPHVCPFCGKVTEERICGPCRKKLVYIGEPRCMRCGKPVRLESSEYCLDCGKRSWMYDRGYALWVHSKEVQKSIYQFKYHNRRIFGRFYAEELLSRYETAVRRWNISLIIPIPLSRKRRRIRGYNQAEILAEEIGRRLGLPVDGRHLVRIRDTSPQKKLGAAERKRNLRGAFAWKGTGRLRGNVLLVDDIYTTGNTIHYAAGTLKQAGADKVYFLTISIGQGY